MVSFDGLPMASALPAGMDEDRVAAMSAALLSLGERAAEGLGRGELSQVYIEGENGTVFLVSADDEAVLVAVAAAGAKVGLMLYEVRRAASRSPTCCARTTPRRRRPPSSPASSTCTTSWRSTSSRRARCYQQPSQPRRTRRWVRRASDNGHGSRARTARLDLVRAEHRPASRLPGPEQPICTPGGNPRT